METALPEGAEPTSASGWLSTAPTMRSLGYPQELFGILQSYAGPEAHAAEIREELQRVSEMAKKTGLIK